MLRQVEFMGNDNAHKVYFRMIYEAFRSRGSAKPDERVSNDDNRKEGRILKALKKIGDEVPLTEEEQKNVKPGQDLGVRDLVLSAKGGVLKLEQPDFSLLYKYVQGTQFVSVLADVKCDLEDWLDSAAKIEPEKAA